MRYLSGNSLYPREINASPSVGLAIVAVIFAGAVAVLAGFVGYLAWNGQVSW